MSKTSKSNRKTARAGRPAKPSRLRQWWDSIDIDARRRHFVRAGWVILGVLAIVGTVVGLGALQHRVVQTCYAGDEGKVTVRVTAVPGWMPASLAGYVTEKITPPGASLSDPNLAQAVYELAKVNPLVARIERVKVVPATNGPGGVVEVDLKFRQPIARVRSGSEYAYVDAEGVYIPGSLAPTYVVSLRDNRTGRLQQVCYQARSEVPARLRPYARPIHYITIDGVAATSPPPGYQWNSPDLDDAIRLIQLVRAKPYYAQISVVDVRNYAGRITPNEPEIRMYAQIGRERATDIRFGRFPKSGGDYVVSPSRKLAHLDDYAASNNGRIAGLKTYLDLRYDNLHVSLN